MKNKIKYWRNSVFLQKYRRLTSIRHKIKNILHWKLGIHFFKPLGVIGVLPHEKESGRYVWCSMCGSKFEAHQYLFNKLYR